ncbi:ABC transporter permease [Fredinandcohnia quinoae]|nr:ABC transporter permease [Fredinandcohnia sp. SECRCQ15]
MKQFVKNPVSLLFLFIIPIGATIGLGSLFEKGQEELAIPIALVDEDKSDFSKIITKRMSDQSKITITNVSREKAEKLLATNEVDSIFMIKQGFQDNLLQEKREDTIEVWVSPSSMAVGIVREVMASEVIRLTSNIKAAEHVEKLYNQKGIEDSSIWDEAYAYTDAQWDPEPLMTIDYIEQRGKDIVDAKSEIINPYLGLWTFFTMLACFLAIDWIIKERNTIFARIQTTYQGLSSYLWKSISGYFILHVLQAFMSFIIFIKLDIVENRMSLLVAMILYLFICMSLSVLFASFTRNLNSYYISSFLFVLIVGVLGGSFFPVPELSEVFPQSFVQHTATNMQTILAICVSSGLIVFAIRRVKRDYN